MEQANMEPVVIEDLVKLGEERGRIESVALMFARRLDRTLTAAERTTLEQRLATLGQTRLVDVAFSSGREALAAWLANPAAR